LFFFVFGFAFAGSHFRKTKVTTGNNQLLCASFPIEPIEKYSETAFYYGLMEVENPLIITAD